MAVTIKDVAREAGVAASTVSKYINGGHVLGENKDAIEAAIKKLGYHLNMSAHAMRAGNSKTIMLLVPQLNNIFCIELLNVSQRILQENGYSVIVAESRCDSQIETMLLQRAISRNVDGVITMPVDPLNSGYRDLETHKIPFIVFRPVYKDKNTNSIVFDEMDKTFELLSTAYKLGHRQVGFILSDVRKMIIEARGINHFNSQLATTGLNYNNNYVYTASGNDFDTGVKGARYLLNLIPHPTLIFCFNSELLMGAYCAAAELGLKIPEDVSLCGTIQENTVNLPPYTGLTSVVVPITSAAKRTVSMLLQYLDHSDSTHGIFSTVHLNSYINDGGSLGPAPAEN